MPPDSVTADIADRPGAVVAIMTLRRRVSIFALLLASEFFYGWSWNSVDVLRPFLRASLTLSLLQAGSLYSAQGAGALCGAIVLGQLADRFGRRRLLAVTIFGYAAMLLLGLLVMNYPELLAQRFLLGIFLGACFPIHVGIYVTLFPPSLRGRLAGALNASFSGSIIVLGLAFGLVTQQDWTLLLWAGGLPPLALGALALLLVPPEPAQAMGLPGATGRLPVAELFRAAHRTRTIALATMTGLNFFGYQAYDGWLTTYLVDVRHFSSGVSGMVLAWQFAGNICGGFAWGWIGDRLGRRFNATGFLALAVAILLFLASPRDVALLCGISFLSGAALCSSVIWGPWFAELYPPHLRSTAASIFNWGRIISFFAPLATATIANRLGLPAAMSAGSVSFTLAAILWLMQPETLRRPEGAPFSVRRFGRRNPPPV